jgi:hypothetical protein
MGPSGFRKPHNLLMPGLRDGDLRRNGVVEK